ncbi:MAG: hypothetical protein QM726_17170 [Chitinophagaceae bacterium]
MRPLILFLFSLSILCVHAQDSSLLKNRIFKINIRQSDSVYTNGWLTDITDSSVWVSNVPLRFRSPASNTMQSKEFVYHQIDLLRLKRPKGALRGFGIGLFGGFAGGALLGFLSGDDTSGLFRLTAAEKALAAGIGLGISAAIVGTIIGGLAKKTFLIKHKKESFNPMYNYVIEKTYRSIKQQVNN